MSLPAGMRLGFKAKCIQVDRRVDCVRGFYGMAGRHNVAEGCTD